MLALRAHEGGVADSHLRPAIAFSDDGRRLLTSSQRTLRSWNVETGALESEFTASGGSYSVVFSPDFRFVAYDRQQAVVIADLEHPDDEITVSAHENEVRYLAFSPQGNRLASADFEGEIKLWRLQRCPLRLAPDLPLETPPSRSRIGWLSFDASGNMLVASQDVGATIWDSRTGKLSRRIETNGPGHYVGFSPDGEKLAMSVENHLKLWDVASGREILALGEPHVSPAGTFAFSPDGSKLAWIYDGQIHLSDTTSRRTLLTFPGFAGRRTALAFSPNGKLLAALMVSGDIRVWKVAE
jgi:WD40 repeat protein